MLSKVAVITRTRDRTLLLERAMRSVLAQSLSDWVHVIVNDGGSEQPVGELVARHADAYAGRLVLVNHPESLGMEAASNAGIAACESEYILIHDDDDTLEAAFLATCVQYLEAPPAPSIGAVASLVTRVDEVIVGEQVRIRSRTPYRALGSCVSMEDIAQVNPCPPISLLFRRALLERIGGFDETLPVLGDWDFIARLVSVADIGIVQQHLANYHLRPSLTGGSMSNTIHGQVDKHRFFDCLLRNRFARSEQYWRVGQLMQMQAQASPRAQLARLYDHAVIGRIIRLWAALVNPGIVPRD